VVNEDGEYRIQGLASGAVDVVAAGGGYLEAVRRVEVREGQRSIGNDFVLELGGAVAGRVVDETGEPVAGAEVLVRDFGHGFKELRAISGPGGRFRVGGISAKDFVEMEVSHDEHLEFIAEKVAVGSSDLVLELERGGEIRGRVVDESGTPRAGIAVYLLSKGEGSQDSRTGRTDGDGRFRFTGLAPALYEVRARNQQPAAAEQVEIAPRSSVEVLLRLP
jgi:hypothetical protein